MYSYAVEVGVRGFIPSSHGSCLVGVGIQMEQDQGARKNLQPCCGPEQLFTVGQA